MTKSDKSGRYSHPSVCASPSYLSGESSGRHLVLGRATNMCSQSTRLEGNSVPVLCTSICLGDAAVFCCLPCLPRCLYPSEKLWSCAQSIDLCPADQPETTIAICQFGRSTEIISGHRATLSRYCKDRQQCHWGQDTLFSVPESTFVPFVPDT